MQTVVMVALSVFLVAVLLGVMLLPMMVEVVEAISPLLMLLGTPEITNP